MWRIEKHYILILRWVPTSGHSFSPLSIPTPHHFLPTRPGPRTALSRDVTRMVRVMGWGGRGLAHIALPVVLLDSYSILGLLGLFWLTVLSVHFFSRDSGVWSLAFRLFLGLFGPSRLAFLLLIRISI